MIIHGFALAGLLAQCAPNVAPSTMAAIVQVESGGDPWAIDDDSSRRSYHPADRASAEALARVLIERGHQVDLGLAQIDSDNFSMLSVSVETIFDPCTNLRAGSEILASDYALAVQRYGPGAAALRHAIGMYNTGNLNDGAGYVREVLAAAGLSERDERFTRVLPERDAMRSPVLVSTSVARQVLFRTAQSVAAPSQAPVLVTIVRRLRVTVF